jgi:hypothetical protein
VREDVVGVDPGVAGSHLLGNARAASQIARPDAIRRVLLAPPVFCEVATIPAFWPDTGISPSFDDFSPTSLK